MDVLVILLIWVFFGWKIGLLSLVLYVGYETIWFIRELWISNKPVTPEELHRIISTPK
jgi:hypothetical protein